MAENNDDPPFLNANGFPRHLYWILDRHGHPQEEPDLITWAKWMEASHHDQSRVVAHDHIHGYLVSTVFLGLDHQFGIGGPPILWEPMIFPAQPDATHTRYRDFQRRYTSRTDAELGHTHTLQMIDRDHSHPAPPTTDQDT
jgi:hypothetical protein